MTKFSPTCPLDYRYSCEEIASVQGRSAAALYIVGGLYGNVQALEALKPVIEAEPGAEVVFNGDFNWFNIDDRAYAEINSFVLSRSALRGNVETELSQIEDRGCGCNYPEWVDEQTVTRSNRIISILQETANRNRGLTDQLSALPRYAVYTVADHRIGIVHGDAESLSGWGFAQEHLSDRDHLKVVRRWLVQARVDVFAGSHTCLPVMQRIPMDTSCGWIINNGSAGMPNFSSANYGLITRIGTSPSKNTEPVYSARHGPLYLEAIPLHYDHPRWVADFERNWPNGSTAHQSYFKRINTGPDYEPKQAVRF